MKGRPSDRKLLEAPRFSRAKRRMTPDAQRAVDETVRGIAADPLSGEPKIGALRGVRVVKFKVGRQQFLLAYEFHPKGNRIDVLDVGPHENFYRDLQRYRESR